MLFNVKRAIFLSVWFDPIGNKTQGRIQGGGAHAPLKIEKNMIFWA